MRSEKTPSELHNREDVATTANFYCGFSISLVLYQGLDEFYVI